MDVRFLLLRACLGVVLAVASHARAEGRSRVGLRYEVGEGTLCPSEREFRSTVVELLGYDPFVGNASRSVAVEISGTKTELQGSLKWRNVRGELEGERRFDSSEADCQRLARNMAFAVTVQIQLYNAPSGSAASGGLSGGTSGEASSSGRESTPKNASSLGEPAQSQSTTLDSDAAREEVGAPTPASSTSSRYQLGGGAGPFVVFGWAPSASPGGSLLLVGRAEGLALELGVEVTLPSRFDREDGSGFDAFALAGSMRPCLRWQPIESCLVLRLAQVRVRGFGVDESRSPNGFFSQVGVRFAVTPPIAERLELRPYAELVRTLSPWRVRLNQTDAFESPLFSVLLGLELLGFFP